MFSYQNGTGVVAKRRKDGAEDCAVKSVYIYTRAHASIVLRFPPTRNSDIRLKTE